MASTRLELRGRRGWLTVGTLTLALVAAVATQAHSPAARADLTPVAQTSSLSPSVTASPATPASDEGPATPAAAPETVADSAPAAVPAPAAAPRNAAPRAAAPRREAPRRTASSEVCSGPDWQTKRGQAALASLRDSGQRSGVSVSFKGAKAGYLGLTYPAQRHVDVFVRSCSAESTTLLRHVISHEMGHAYDAAHMTPALRDAYTKMRGIPAGTAWFGCNYCSDFATPAGDFAETYSQWQRGSSDSRTKMAPMPGSAQLADIAAAYFQG